MIRSLATQACRATPAVLAGAAVLLLGACNFRDEPVGTGMAPSMAANEPPALGPTGGGSGGDTGGGGNVPSDNGTGASGAGANAAGSGGNSQAGSDDGSGNDAPPPQGACAKEGETRPCYDGPADTDGVGACRAGQQSCQSGEWSACEGQVQPQDETCDGADNDCDGEVDDGLTLGSCVPEGSDEQLSECATYRLVCIDGATTCAPTDETPAEQCNGKDDDCDGKIDEEADTSCYTYRGAGTPGCQRVDGEYQCRGICQVGTQKCVGGRLTGSCEGQVTPRIAEVCGESPAVDDNCDGAVDEGCPCEPNKTQPCYTGPVGTRGVGQCQDGVQTCRSFLSYTGWGSCLSQTVPATEMCETVGKDNDCDGASDDIDVEGATCVTGERGICAFGVARCEADVTECDRLRDPTNELCNNADDDCDGATDEDFDLESNRNRCGSCTNRCSSGQDCCEGGCVDVNTDEQNCGGCGASCANGETCSNGRCGCSGPNSYCNGVCVSPSWFSNNNANCGSCNHRCPADQVCIGTMCQLP